MFKKLNTIKILAITILFSMVFGVNIGLVYASSTSNHKINVSSKLFGDDSTTTTYLNDVVVNNSTTTIPIPYGVGTINREINFDYSFSENTDIAITYSLAYNDNSPVNNVELNIINREDYLIDTNKTTMASNNSVYDLVNSEGTMLYLGKLQGQGTHKLFSGVNFYEESNIVKNYKAKSSVNLYQRTYPVGVYTYNEFTEITSDVARYWKPITENNTTMYQCVESYAITGITTPVSINHNTQAHLTYNEYQAKLYPQECWGANYIALITFTANGTTFTAGSSLTPSQYIALSDLEKNNVEVKYVCVKEYTVTGANHRNVSANTIITAEEFGNLSLIEKKFFSPFEREAYGNKYLEIQLQVHTRLSAKTSPSTYYNNSHSFSAYCENQEIFDLWKEYKRSGENINSMTITDGAKLLLYGSRTSFDTGVPYSYDFSYGEDITLVSNHSNITTSYLYSDDGKFYLHTDGNKVKASLGIYYITKNQGSIELRITANWYDSRGSLVTGIPVNNIEIGVNNKFVSKANGYGLSSTISANSYGYIDVLDYIQNTSKASVNNLIGYRMVITNIIAVYKTSGFDWSISGGYTNDLVSIENSTKSNPILYTYSGHLRVTSIFRFDMSVINNTNNAIKYTGANAITLKPKFVAYNGQTGAEYDTQTKYSRVSFIYDNNSWTVSETGNETDGYVYKFTSNCYIPAKTSINLIKGVSIAGQSSPESWKINLNNAGQNILLNADYYFQLEDNLGNYTNESTLSGSNSNLEFMSVLTHSTLNGGANGLVGIRNNTNAVVGAGSSVSFSLKDKTNSSGNANYKVFSLVSGSYLNGGAQYNNTSTVTITLPVNIFPGESLVLARIDIMSGSNNVYMDNYGINANLTNMTALSYFKRDLVSKNVSFVNNDTDSVTLQFTMTGGTPTVNELVGGDKKWNISGSTYEFTKGNASELANIQPNQLLKIMTNITGMVYYQFTKL